MMFGRQTFASATADLLVLANFLLSFINVVVSSLTSTGQTLLLNDIPYYIPATPYTTIPLLTFLHALDSASGLVPVTVTSVSALNNSLSALQDAIAGYGTDDVWNRGFLEAILVQYYGGATPPYPSNISFTLPGVKEGSVICVLPSSGSSSAIPSGPYFASPDGSLYQPLRLYSDFQGAFTQPLISTSDGTYAALPANVAGIQSPAVGVPSRLYYTATPSKPLAGIRLGVKDIYDIAGVKTSNGNRAWYGLFPPATANAVAVQRLIDAGAIIVGKMKTSQFANGETATADWVDYHSPFNPRGDGYQDPSSSSSGPGSGEGSYPWLDISLGSDTGGSIRGPCQVQGLFGNRPSHGLAPLTGVMPLAPQLDTAGFLTRDPAIWSAAAKALYADLPFYTQYPKKLYTIGLPKAEDNEADSILLKFLNKLEDFLGTTSKPLNLSTLWNSTHPPGVSPNINTFLNLTYPILISKEQTTLVRDPFYAAYGAIHDGRRPFIDPAPLVRWAFGDSNPTSALAEAVSNKTHFQNWWASEIQSNDTTTCSDSLVVYSASSGGVAPFYRNQYLGPPQVPFGFSTGRISPFAEVPDFVVPVGQAGYFSNITRHVEVLPVTVDLLAAKGCDGLLFSLISDLQAAGIVNTTLAGGTIAGGDILLRS